MGKSRKKPVLKKGQTAQQNYRDRLYGYRDLFFKTLQYIDKGDSHIPDELKIEYVESLTSFENALYIYELGNLEKLKLEILEETMGEQS